MFFTKDCIAWEIFFKYVAVKHSMHFKRLVIGQAHLFLHEENSLGQSYL